MASNPQEMDIDQPHVYSRRNRPQIQEENQQNPQELGGNPNLTNTGNSSIPSIVPIQETMCDDNSTSWERLRRKYNLPSKPGWKYYGLRKKSKKDGLRFNHPIPCFHRGSNHASYEQISWVSDF